MSLASLPVGPCSCGAETGVPSCEVLALVPYRQLAERGFAAPDADEPLLALSVAARRPVPVPELLARLPHLPTPTTGRGFDLGDEEYAVTALPRPARFTGYRLRPAEVEFWCADPERLHLHLHRRPRYDRRDDGRQPSRLQPCPRQERPWVSGTTSSPGGAAAHPPGRRAVPGLRVRRPDDAEEIHAAIVPSPGHTPDPARVKEFMTARLGLTDQDFATS
ncbi:pyridoxine 5'-phosphate oxidase C-terminal domain-containing protein [Streptomyces sp. NPDC004237]|uniref:pyridoxine 5'-phosphate oxidase C-terminal domain-containing protein n=1 Tax=Streptomyces sp. NPDC004237 TaxID=3154455 RepID=UPI0033A50C93